MCAPACHPRLHPRLCFLYRVCVLALPRIAQALALALYSGRFWPVSVALVAKVIGATTAGSFSRGSSFATALALRSAVNHDSKAPSHRQSRLPSAGEFRYSCQDLPVPMVSTLEQEIDALIERADVSKEELLSALRMRESRGERDQIGGEANNSTTADAIKVSIVCDTSGAPCPQRRASIMDRPLEYRGAPVLPPPAWWGIDPRESDGSVSDSDSGASSGQWSSRRASAAFVLPPQRARGTDSTFPSAAGCDRSEVVRV